MFFTIGEGWSDGEGLCLWGPSYQILERTPRWSQIHFARTAAQREIEMVQEKEIQSLALFPTLGEMAFGDPAPATPEMLIIYLNKDKKLF